MSMQPQRRRRYSTRPFATSAPEGTGGPRQLKPRERNDTYCRKGWLGLGAGLDGQEKSRPIGIRCPDRQARSESPICYFDRLFLHGINSFEMDCILYTFLYEQVPTFYSNCGYTCCAACGYTSHQGKIMFSSMIISKTTTWINLDTEREV